MMMVMRISISILFVLLIGNPLLMLGQVTTVTGTARDAKYGAVVVTANNEVYYLDKMETWNKEMIGKQVRVAGKVVVREPKQTDTISAEITTPVKIIKRPKVEKVE